VGCEWRRTTTPGMRALSSRPPPLAPARPRRGWTLAATARPAAPVPQGPVPASDDAVPEAHKGLHATLYGDRGADVHDAEVAVGEYRLRPVRGGGDGGGAAVGRRPRKSSRHLSSPISQEDDGSAITPVDAWLAARAGATVAGAFEVSDAAGRPQFISFARDAVSAVRGARDRAGPTRAAGVRAALVSRALVSRAALEATAAAWLAAAPSPPPGNGSDAALFAGVDRTGRTAAQEAAHGARTAKMQAAMADARQEENDAASPTDPALRSAAMRAAVEGGDWSAVIDAQTAATTAGVGAPATPFAGAAPSAASHPSGDQPLLTVEAAEAALDEVRHYLISDGGDARIESVDGGVVRVRLQGACGTCASAGATMALGIERAMRGRFGAQVVAVERVEEGAAGAADPAAPPDAASIDSMLDSLRPAIAAYGGSVTVASVDAGGVCTLAWAGPAPISAGVVAAVRDRFPTLADVVLEMTEESE